MTFFFDRNVPIALARMLDHYDRQHDTVYLDDRFPKTTADSDWLVEIAKWDPKPVVISGDGRILSNPAERQVLSGLPLSFFVFAEGWCNLAWRERAWKTVKVWPRIVEAANCRRPTVFRVPMTAQKVEQLWLTAEIVRRK